MHSGSFCLVVVPRDHRPRARRSSTLPNNSSIPFIAANIWKQIDLCTYIHVVFIWINKYAKRCHCTLHDDSKKANFRCTQQTDLFCQKEFSYLFIRLFSMCLSVCVCFCLRTVFSPVSFGLFTLAQSCEPIHFLLKFILVFFFSLLRTCIWFALSIRLFGAGDWCVIRTGNKTQLVWAGEHRCARRFGLANISNDFRVRIFMENTINQQTQFNTHEKTDKNIQNIQL